jgi:hypothetical protein
LRKYPDEDRGALVSDLTVAASEAHKVLQRVLALPDGPYLDTAAAIDGLTDVLMKAAATRKPLWRKMLENYFTSVQPTPLPHRVARAREHLIAAGNVLAQRTAPVD